MKIVVEIDCGKKTCQCCKKCYTKELSDQTICGVFNKPLEIALGPSLRGYIRLSECLAAEAEMAGLEEMEKEHKVWNDADCNKCPLSAFEACEEICRSKAMLIQKIAELDEGNDANLDAIKLAKEGMSSLLENLRKVLADNQQYDDVNCYDCKYYYVDDRDLSRCKLKPGNTTVDPDVEEPCEGFEAKERSQ